MTKKESPGLHEIPSAEALARYTKGKTKELAETLAEDVLEGQARAKKHIASARQEIEDGARPRKDRFRL